MPSPENAQPKQHHGGDDDSSGGDAEKPKKPRLTKFGLLPDLNVRDTLGKIIDAYSLGSKPPLIKEDVENQRLLLSRTAISTVFLTQNEYHGIDMVTIAEYVIRMFLDFEWVEELGELIDSSHIKMKTSERVAKAIKNLLAASEYRQKIVDLFLSYIRSKEFGSSALEYVSLIGDIELINAMKKELLIIARGDIGKNQANAISALSNLKNEDIKKMLIGLLTHWDVDARYAAARALLKFKEETDVKEAATRRLNMESEVAIIKILTKINSI